MKYNYAIFIGRMQPPHKKHIQVIKNALDNLASEVIILLGSHGVAPDTRNPWTTSERKEMIKLCFTKKEQERLIFVNIRDYLYNNQTWFTQVEQAVVNVYDDYYDQWDPITLPPSICLIGCKKDESSWYIDHLPESWERELSNNKNTCNSTDTRDLYFKKDLKFSEDLSPEVTAYLLSNCDPEKNRLYETLCESYMDNLKYKALWAQAPYPVTFVTADTVVVKAGHILLVRRKFNPGKGLLALPGGFINQNEHIIDSAIRELKEETRIAVPKKELKSHIIDQKVFDHPNRSLRGRTITHAYCIHLPGPGLPKVKGSDDAERAVWLPLAEVDMRSTEFFEDHIHIIRHFVSKL